MAEKIQEFLAELGFKVDQGGLRIMETALGQFAKGTLAMVTAFSAGMTTIVLGLRKVASTYEQLYYIAQRSGASVEGLRELEYAFGQIGMSAGDAAQAVEGIAAAMRGNPGMEGMLKALGVQTRTANGAMRDTTQITVDLVKRLSQMPFYVAKQYAAMFGISERTLIQMEQHINDVAAAERRYRETAKAAGLDQEKLAAESREFMNAWRTLSTDIEVAFDTIAEQSLPALTEAMKKAGKFIVSHFGDIKDIARQVGDVFAEDTQEILKLLPQMNELVKATIGWKTVLEAIGAIILYRILGPIGVTIGAITWAINKYHELQKDFEEDKKEGKLQTDNNGNQFYPGWSFKSIWNKLFHHSSFRPLASNQNLDQRAGHVMHALMTNLGLSQDQAAGVASNLAAESGIEGIPTGMAPMTNRSAFGWAQWTGPRRVAFDKYVQENGLDPRSFDANFGFLMKELTGKYRNVLTALLKTHSAQEAARLFFHMYESGGDAGLEKYLNSHVGYADHFSKLRLGDGNASRGHTNVHQENHIKIDGAHSPIRTGQEVAQAQRRVNADLIRNLTGAVVA